MCRLTDAFFSISISASACSLQGELSYDSCFFFVFLTVSNLDREIATTAADVDADASTIRGRDEMNVQVG